MITTLDAQPQEWMQGDASIFHTVAACQFENVEHIEHWVNLLVPKNQNGEFVKWSGGRRTENTRNQFIDNCTKYSSDIDFKVNCISTSEGQMSWFAWAYYFRNQPHIKQQTDSKGRNCLVFPISENNNISFPILRSGYLIWYFYVIKYLVEVKNIDDRFLSDNFACDEEGIALGVSFVNYLLGNNLNDIQISLPRNNRYRECDRISDYFCGWVNSIHSGSAADTHDDKFNDLEAVTNNGIESIIYNMDLEITDKNGNNITQTVKEAVANNS